MFSVPESFKTRYCGLVDDADAFLASLESYLPKSFRVNTLKAGPEEVRSRFSAYGINVAQMPWYGAAFTSESPDVGSTLEHFLGHIYIQELVSMLPPLLVRDELGSASLVLDGCAAPGSKTTEMAALMRNKGTIIANDLDYSRIRALKFNLEKAGALNTVITNRNLLSFPETQNGLYDVVLLDAPCSSEGTMRKSERLFSAWKPSDIPKYSKIQKAMAVRCFDLLKPGGSMVYSTCTFAPEENEEVVDWLLQNRQDAKLEAIAVPGMTLTPGITGWERRQYDGRVRRAARIWPHHNDTGGFFMAKVVK